jgi:hypothetical protein
MKTVEVSRKSLELLINQSLKNEIHDRAQTMVFLEGERNNPEAARRYIALVESAIPEASKIPNARYAEILSALEAGSGISEALTRLVG